MAKRARAKKPSKRTASKPVAKRGAASRAKTTKKATTGARKRKVGARKDSRTSTGSRTSKAATRSAAKPKRTQARRNTKASGAATKATPKRTARKTLTPKTTRKSTSKKKGIRRAAVPRAGARGSDQPSDADAIGVRHEERPLPKTNLTDKQLEEFRQLLLIKRAELAGDVRQLTQEALNQSGGASGDRSSMPIHMADLGSDNWEQEFTLGLIANERTRVQKIDEALARISDKTYGICLATHKRISLARLRAKPWAKYCIEYARLRDEGRAL